MNLYTENDKRYIGQSYSQSNSRSRSVLDTITCHPHPCIVRKRSGRMDKDADTIRTGAESTAGLFIRSAT